MLNTTAIGYLGNDAVIKEVNGKKVTEFSIAHTEKWKDAKGQQMERTTWVNCSMWDAGNVTQYLKKGTQVFVYGTPSVSAYLSKKDNSPAADFRLSVMKVELLGGKKDATPAPASTGTGGYNAAMPDSVVNDLKDVPDDLPF